MKVTIAVLRCERGSSDQYIQKFFYETASDQDTIASALTEINNRIPLTDTDGNPARPISWECSCLQKKCGACAMVINGRPGLACDVKIADIKKREILLEPLRKFPRVEDLTVDRSILYENLKTMELWLREDADLSEEDRDLAYMASECIQCGCCLEVCPNFYAGGSFFGMAAVPVTTRLLTEMDKSSYREIARHYSRHVFEGCGKSLSCKDICPRKIDTEKLLVNANAMAVWKRKKKRRKKA